MRSLKTLKNLSDLLSPVNRWKNDLWGEHKKQRAVCLVWVLFMLSRIFPSCLTLIEDFKNVKFWRSEDETGSYHLQTKGQRGNRVGFCMQPCTSSCAQPLTTLHSSNCAVIAIKPKKIRKKRKEKQVCSSMTQQ